jgi:hypothetical protein
MIFFLTIGFEDKKLLEQQISKIIASIAAFVSSYWAPTIAKNISVDKTSYSAPSTNGLPKSAKLSIKPSRKALAIPRPH